MTCPRSLGSQCSCRWESSKQNSCRRKGLRPQRPSWVLGGGRGLWPSYGSPPSTPLGRVRSAPWRPLRLGAMADFTRAVQAGPWPIWHVRWNPLIHLFPTHGVFVFQRLRNFSRVVLAWGHVFTECRIPANTGGAANVFHALIGETASAGGTACERTEPWAWPYTCVHG